jgi:DNA-binding response OmpR family regulator
MKRLNVLILENETVTCQSLVGILQNMGVDNIFVASNHTEAVGLARKYRFHIMLSAVKINDRYDGVDTVKALREFYSFAVIFICSYNDEKTLLKVSEVEFVGYLLKPYRADEIETLIAIAVKKYRFLEEETSLKISGKYSFDSHKNILYHNGSPVVLTKKERLFFSLFFHNLDLLIPYSVIDEVVWNNMNVHNNTRRTFLYRIRKRFPDLDFKIIRNVGILPNQAE